MGTNWNRVIKLHGPIEALKVAKVLGYKRSVTANGNTVITDGFVDWIYPPSFTMRQARDYQHALNSLPLVPWRVFK
jgi:hypothetical protein